MTENLKMAKIVTGDTVIGIEDGDKLTDVVNVQAVPMGQSVIQIALLPFGFPYEETIRGSIDMKHVLFEYEKLPEDLKNKYVEAKSNIKIAAADELNNLGGQGGPQGGGDKGGSGLIL